MRAQLAGTQSDSAGGDQGAGEAQEDEERQRHGVCVVAVRPERGLDQRLVLRAGLRLPRLDGRGLVLGRAVAVVGVVRAAARALEGAAGGEARGLGLLLEVAVGADVLGHPVERLLDALGGVGAVDAPVLRPVVDDLLPAGLRLRCEGRRGCCENSRAADKQDEEERSRAGHRCSLPLWGELNLNGV